MKPDDLAALVDDDYAVLIDFLAFDQPDRRDRAAVAMKLEQPIEPQIGHFVAADDDKRLVAEEALRRSSRRRRCRAARVRSE